MATTVNIAQARSRLSKLIEQAERGEDVVIARAGKPAVRLVKVQQPEPPVKRLGFLTGQGFHVPDDIKTAFQQEMEEMFYGRPESPKDVLDKH